VLNDASETQTRATSQKKDSAIVEAHCVIKLGRYYPTDHETTSKKPLFVRKYTILLGGASYMYILSYL